MKNLDLLGNEVKIGDVMLELERGFRSLNGGEYKFISKIWEVPEIQDGRGNYYTIGGELTYFYWANINMSIKIDMSLMPEGFEFSFKHGMTDIETKIESGTIQELIKNSNWEDYKIKKQDLDDYNVLKKLEMNTIDDIKKNINKLKKDNIPIKIVHRVLEISGASVSPVINGELGRAMIQDQLHYESIIKYIDETN